MHNLFKRFSATFENAIQQNYFLLNTLFGCAFRLVVWNFQALALYGRIAAMQARAEVPRAPVRSCLFLRAELAVLVRDHGRALVFERHEVVVVLLFGEGAYLRLFLFCHGLFSSFAFAGEYAQNRRGL